MKCLAIVLLAIATISAEQQCTPRSYCKTECNTCVCSDDGAVSICTQRASLPDLYNQDGSLKVPLDVIQRIISEASEIEIVKAELVGEGHAMYVEVCTPNAYFRIACNHCRCSELGTHYSCTRNAC